MKSEELNNKIADISDGFKYKVKGIECTGKQIPYIGWYWRDIDFNAKEGYPIGKIEPSKEDEKNRKELEMLIGAEIEPETEFIGFIANNKWGYEERYTTPTESKKIRTMLEGIAKRTTLKKLQKFFDYMQTLEIK